ncbi:polycystic kidney disease protein 1-like 2 [Arapaima gigas]
MAAARVFLLSGAVLLCLGRPCAQHLAGDPLCAPYQEAFNRSCYEFVSLQRSCFSAQAWCERGGGHLAFVLNNDTQQFLQRHLSPKEDFWLGLAPTFENPTLEITAPEGSLVWLDGSDVSYANWARFPTAGAHCGHILRDSGFQWEATDNCSQEFSFVCEFESGRSLACADHNTTLQCGSGQVIEVDNGFYGRKMLHFCRRSPDHLAPTPSSAPQEECSWTDVRELVSGHCHWQQVCQVTAGDVSSGDPCPGLGSYLSVEYRCTDGLLLLVGDSAVVLDNITITIKWLLHPFQGNLTCTLNTGDGQTIDPYSPEGSESRVVHRYTHAGVYTITVECSTSEWHVAAQRAVVIQEPAQEFGIIRCYSSNRSWDSSECTGAYGGELAIQVELEAGTDIAYRVQRGETILATATASRGIVPHNITVGSQAQQQLGAGCHQVALLASNDVTATAVSRTLQLCLLEPVGGLWASVEPGGRPCLNPELRVSVSLSRGAPVQLHFLVSGNEKSFSDTKEMRSGSLQVFSIRAPFEGGPMSVKVRAANSISDMVLDVGNTAVVCNKSEALLRWGPPFKNYNNFRINVSPSPVYFNTSSVQLTGKNIGSSPLTYTWMCSKCTGIMSSCPTTLFAENINNVTLSNPNLLSVTSRVVAVGFSNTGYTGYNTYWIWNRDKQNNSSSDPSNGTSSSPSNGTSSGSTPGSSTDLPILSCSILPTEGTVLTSFSISCSTSLDFCPMGSCRCCVTTSSGQYLFWGNNLGTMSLFLPLGEKTNEYMQSLSVQVTSNQGKTISTPVTAKASNSSISLQDLQGVLSQQVDQWTLPQVAQLCSTVSTILNSAATLNQQKAARMKLRQEMLGNILTAVQTSPSISAQDVQVAAEAIADISQEVGDISASAQVTGSLVLEKLSHSLLLGNSSSNSDMAAQTLAAAGSLITAASNILAASTGLDQQPSSLQGSTISGHLLGTVDNVQTALLAGMDTNQEPIVLQSPKINISVKKKLSDELQGVHFIQNSISPSFSLPDLGSSIQSLSQPVGVRMTSFGVNPFSWSGGIPISGVVGGLSLTTESGSTIPVENLSSEIEIFLPRPNATQVNTTLLDLGNFSTVAVDVSTANTSLVLKLDPSEKLTLQLLLGFQQYPNQSYNMAQTTVPHQGNTQEEQYTWVIGPGNLTKTGIYYLLVKPVVGPGVNSSNATVSITSISAQCLYWYETKSNWSNAGCKVGPLTTPLATQCLCNHLTFFGSSFFVMPNVVDVSRTAELFATFANNPVVVCFVAAITLVYLLVLVWARRKDIRDKAKVKITVLEDNDPLSNYRYVLHISTGHRHGASTSSQVTVILLGSEGESDPHHLKDPDKPLFERGAVDMFLLTTPFSLGELQSIRLWHDNTGAKPSWYVSKVMVQDLETGHKWHFLCNSWLAIDIGECVLDQVFPVATEEELKGFSNLFFTKTAKDFDDGHLWFSVISRPPNSNFTRVQRVSCCFSLLLCTMLTSIMFYGIPSDPSQQKMDMGPIEFTWQQVMIGIQSSILMFPVNLLIVGIFRNTRLREKKSQQVKSLDKAEQIRQGNTGPVPHTQPLSPESIRREITPDAVVKDIKKIAQSLSKTLRSPVPEMETTSEKSSDINQMLALVEEIIRQQNRTGGDFYTDSSKKESPLVLSLGKVNLEESSPTVSPERTSSVIQKQRNHDQYLYWQLQHVEKKLELLGPACFPNPNSYGLAVHQVQGMKAELEAHMSTSNPLREVSTESTSPHSSPSKCSCCKGGLPWWFVFVGWFLVVATSAVAGYFTMIYGLTYGKDKSISWLISMVISFFESLFVTQPLKVLGFAVFFALVLKKVDQEEYGDLVFESATSAVPNAVGDARRDSTCSFYQPPAPTDVERMRNNRIKEQKVFALIREIIIYLGFMWTLLMMAYGQKDPNAFYLYQHIQQRFSAGTSGTMSLGDIFNWANSTLLSNLYGQYPGFITDGNAKLVGSARIRQVRVQKDSCTMSSYVRPYIPDCNALYSWEAEDMGSYEPGWSQPANSSGMPANSTLAYSTLAPFAWQYQSQHQLRAHPMWGSIALYRGGGYVADLGPNQGNASNVLQYLFDNTWLDQYTRAIFVEFTVYNANVNLFCIITLMVETQATGSFQYSCDLQIVRLYTFGGGLYFFLIACEAIYFLFILYYMFVQGKKMKQQKWAYFSSKWNLLELAIIILSWSAFSVLIKKTLLWNQDISYYEKHQDQFVSFYNTAVADSVLGYLIAFLVLLSTVKMWHLMRLNSKINMITDTLKRAWNDISGFIIIMTIMFLAYSGACNLMYGWKLSSYRTLSEAAVTIVSLQLGIFNYQEVLDYNLVLGAFLIGSCIIFMTFVVLNLFISVILVAFSKERLNHKPSEEEEIVDLMLFKLGSLIGIKCKKNDRVKGTKGP